MIQDLYFLNLDAVLCVQPQISFSFTAQLKSSLKTKIIYRFCNGHLELYLSCVDGYRGYLFFLLMVIQSRKIGAWN